MNSFLLSVSLDADKILQELEKFIAKGSYFKKNDITVGKVKILPLIGSGASWKKTEPQVSGMQPKIAPGLKRLKQTWTFMQKHKGPVF